MSKKENLSLVSFIVLVVLSIYGFFEKERITDTSTKEIGFTVNCKSHFYNEVEPVIHLPKMLEESQLLCYQGYAGRASYISKSNLYSAEHLTSQKLNVKIERENTFHEEEQLPIGKRSEISDYRRSGFDRGHLAPSADMPSKQAQHESFSLSNMVPQNPEHNRKTWSEVEGKVRCLVKKYGEVYVITLPIYSDEKGRLNKRIQTIGKNNVYIPTFLAKGIYIPKINQAIAIISPNNASNTVLVDSIEQLNQMGNMDLFPQLSVKVKGEMPYEISNDFKEDK